MGNCLFWNMRGQNRTDLLVNLVRERAVELLAIAEPGCDMETTLAALNVGRKNALVTPVSEVARLQVFAIPALGLREVYADVSGRLTVRTIRLGQTDLLFAVVHFVSKLHYNSDDQNAETQVLADQIRETEKTQGHSRTILVGDLNMNPFEPAVVKAAGLHAQSTRESVARGARTVLGREYPFFYNPMWGLFGDRTPGPPGTFWRAPTGHLAYDWNMFDQVLFRPDALPWFQGDIEIVTQIGDTALLNDKGRPNSEIASDHLPLCFRLTAPPEQGA